MQRGDCLAPVDGKVRAVHEPRGHGDMRNEVGTGAVRRALTWPSRGGKGQEGLHTTAHGRRSIKWGLCKTEPNPEEQTGRYQRDERELGQ